MNKIILFVALLLALSLSGCKNLSPVSDTQVLYDIEEYLIPEETCGAYEYTIEHDLDKDARLDTVTVFLVYDWGYCIEEYIGTYVYQHNQSTDLWTLYKPEEWKLDSVKLVEEFYVGTWSGSIYNVSGLVTSAFFSIDVLDVNFEDLSITCDYLIEYEDSNSPEISGNGTFPLSYLTNSTYYFEINDSGYQNTFIIGDGDLCGDSSYKSEFGQVSRSHLFDWELVLTEEESNDLSSRASSISQKVDCGIYMATVDDFTAFSSESPYDAAKAIYTDFGLGLGEEENGILLMISISGRDYSLITHGALTESVFTDSEMTKIENSLFDDFSEDDWYGGFSDYISMCDEVLSHMG